MPRSSSRCTTSRFNASPTSRPVAASAFTGAHSRWHAATHLVIAPSSFTRMELIREGFTPEDVHIARLGIDPPLPREVSEIDAAVAAVGIDAPYVLTVGTIEPRKDLPTIVDAIERLRTRHGSNVELVVVGPSGWGPVPDLDRPFVRVLGAAVVGRRRAPAPRRRMLHRVALRGIRIARARGAGARRAARGCRRLGARRGRGNAALLFGAGDVEACTDALHRLLTDDDLRSELSRLGPARAGELTWAHSAEAHVVAYELAITLRAQRGDS